MTNFKTSWFSKNDLEKNKPNSFITIDKLYGYILPHAGTKYTGNIISNTLRFKPNNKIKNIYIFYYPSSKSPNINNTYYHDYKTDYSKFIFIIS